MTRTIKIILVFMMILAVVSFPLTIFYLFNEYQLKKIEEDLNLYYARKEELLLEQQRLENVVTELNKTLTTTIAKNEELAKELSDLTNSQNTIISLPPKPAIQPPPQRITRAS